MLTQNGLVGPRPKHWTEQNMEGWAPKHQVVDQSIMRGTRHHDFATKPQPQPPTLPSLPSTQTNPVSSLPQEMNKIATNNSLCLVSAVVFLPVLLWPPVSSELVPLSSWQVLGKGKLFSRYRKWKWLKLSVMAHPHLEEGRGLEGEWGREIRVIWAIFHCRLLRPRLTSGWMIALNSWYGLSICVLSVLQRGCWQIYCIP